MTNLATWSDGYVAEIPYTYGSYRELTPAIHNFALALKACTLGATATDSFDYCELGCGQGVSAVMLAAANPGARIFATDFNPTHIAHARKMADEGQVSNARFFDSSFEEMRLKDLPDMDCIALHGVYSWINPEMRRSIVAFVREKLKVGGTLYISYNTLPGWGAMIPLRELMFAHASASAAPIVQRIESAFAFASKVESVGAKYFSNNPGLAARLEGFSKMPRNYLAHEYFNTDFHPMYFRDVARDLSEAKLEYICSAHLTDHIDTINLTHDQILLISECLDPWTRETVRDYITGQLFRRDIYVKGPIKINAHDQLEQLLDMGFVLNQLPSDTPRKATGYAGEAVLQSEIYDPILTALSAGPMSLRRLIEQPGVREREISAILQALAVLIGGGSLHPCPSLEAVAVERRKQSTDRFNRSIMKRARASQDIAYLASPISCSGVEVERFDQLFLLAHIEKAADPTAFVWGLLKAVGQRMVLDGKILEADADCVDELHKKLKVFTTRRLPVYQHLGLV